MEYKVLETVEQFEAIELDYNHLIYTLKDTSEFLLGAEMIDRLPDDVRNILDDKYIKGGMQDD